MNPSLRRRLFACLVLAFFAQTWLVYTDSEGRAAPALSSEAARGREIWLARNCQSCHQIYGFGGFLGPDLTNATEWLTQARVDTVLTEGAGQMPAFGLDAGERAAIVQFLDELSAGGRGQLPPRRSFDAEAVLVLATESAEPLGAGASRGRDVAVREKCIGCHLPNPMATKRATNLTTLVSKLGRGGVAAIVSSGIPAKGMPRFELDAAEQDDLITFLEWLAGNAEAVERTFLEAAPKNDESSGLPWFEYE